MTIIVPDNVNNTLKTFESRNDSFEELELHEAINRSFQTTSETPQDLRNGWWVELTAFHFSEASAGEVSIWNTHFGPIMTAKYQDGTQICRPDIKEIDAEVLDYWTSRTQEAQHPVCRARYADLVWDLSKTITGKRQAVCYATIAIDAYIEVADRVSEKTQMQARRHLERALELSISLNDTVRIVKVKQAIFRLYDRIAEPDKGGTWSYLFDCLYDNNKVPLTQGEEDNIIQSLESILSSTSDFSNKSHFSPWDAQAAAERLEIHYRKKEKPNDVKRVILAYGMAFETLAG